MELLDIVNDNNELIGKIEDRKIVHEIGLWHREVAVIIINEEGKMLLEKRAPTKKQSPNKWALCAGHIEAGDIPENAIVREMKEEIGVDVSINDLEFIKVAKRNIKFNDSLYNRAFQYTYFWRTDKKENEFTVQQEELTEVRYFDMEEVKSRVINKDKSFAFSDEEYITDIINIVEKKIKNKGEVL